MRAAGLALAAGSITYLIFRNNSPALAPTWFAHAQSLLHIHSGVFAALTAHAPSFFHLYAMLLATAAVCPDNTALRRRVFIGSLCLGLALEWAQHPFITHLLDTAAIGGRLPAGIIEPLLSYSRAGVFDLLDLTALALAAVFAAIHISSRTSGYHTTEREPNYAR